jgi:transposase
MTSEKTRTRQRYDAAKKARVLAECDEPGASVAKVALAHGINANVVHRWRQLAREAQASPAKTGEFIALPLIAPAPAPAIDAPMPADIRVEPRRASITMIVTWPVSAAADFAAWTRELLR